MEIRGFCSRSLKNIEYIQWTGKNEEEIKTLCEKYNTRFAVYKHPDKPCDHLYVNNYMVNQFEYIVFDKDLFFAIKDKYSPTMYDYGKVYYNALESKNFSISFTEEEFKKIYCIE